MTSGSSSRDVSIKSIPTVVLALAALLVAAPPSFARSSLDLTQGDLSLAADSSVAQPSPDPAPLSGSDRHAARNPRKALMLSLLLPGLGESYSGHKVRATGFFISEGAIWANFAAWEIAGHLRRNDYIEQAQINAGIGTDSGSDDYWRLVGTYARSSGTGSD